MVIKGKSDSAPEARAIFIGRDSYLGAEIGGKMYWMKESIDDADRRSIASSPAPAARARTAC